jgi:hypothetical protein
MQYVYYYSAMVWAGKASRTWTINSASLLYMNICAKYISCRTAERIHLNELAVLVAHIQLHIQFHILHSVVTPEDGLHALHPRRKYSKMSCVLCHCYTCSYLCRLSYHFLLF